jgi:Spy/CpxP family protein refolding chaperone
MKKNLFRFATVVALGAGMALAQTTAPAPDNGPAKTTTVRPRARFHERMMQALNLTDAQKQQAKSIFQQARQNAQPVVQQMKQNREALAAAVKANDTAQMQSLSAQQGKLRGQLLAIRSQAMAKFYSTLTPDQRAKADQMHARIRQRMQQRAGNHNG